jgi:hypothetical protein
MCNLQETTEAAQPPPYTPGLHCPFLADEVCHPFSLPKLNLLSKWLLLSFGVRLSHVDSEFQIRLDWESVSRNSAAAGYSRPQHLIEDSVVLFAIKQGWFHNVFF